MSKYIYFKNEEGEYQIFASMIESEMESEWERVNPNITEYVICTEKDSDFPFCYEIENNKKVFKLDQAKEITKNRLREERKPLLEAEDIKFMQAQEAGSDTSAIVAEKNRLRDITKEADSCKTADELKALKVVA
tara:strand:+ start:950 stop:1351 length:402 start_codon:yes stop_codon:yes gene_type:complete